MRALKLSLILVTAITVGCGDDGTGSGNPDGGDPNNPVIDAAPGGGDGNTPPGGGDGGTNTADAAPGSQCGLTQCSNCIDDDGDGLIDGFDPHCISAADNDEFSFATGIPGDNKDATKQDCFFDGNSGAGDDGCDIHVCCLLDDCPDANFDPSTCTSLSQQCIDFCAPATPPGCDCFGCCTVCDGANCNDVFIHPVVAPDCDVDVLGDPTLCPTCTKSTECTASECDPTNCVLCPGQTEDDLPAECNNQNECTDGRTPCDVTSDCAADEYCSAGCCTAGIIVGIVAP